MTQLHALKPNWSKVKEFHPQRFEGLREVLVCFLMKVVWAQLSITQLLVNTDWWQDFSGKAVVNLPNLFINLSVENVNYKPKQITAVSLCDTFVSSWPHFTKPNKTDLDCYVMQHRL